MLRSGNVTLCITILLSIIISLVIAKIKPVQVTLDAKWNSTPILLEASEFMADEGLFQTFVSKLHENKYQGDTEQEWYSIINKMVTGLLSSARLRLLELSLAMRLYTPRIQLHQQLASSSGSAGQPVFAVVNGQVIGDKRGVSGLLQTGEGTANTLYKTDLSHCVADCHLPTEPSVIVYGQLGSRALRDFLENSFGCFTVLRHFVQEGHDHGRKVRLSGYGVELAVKSTEYKAQDDSKKEAEQIDEPLEGEVGGFNFTRLGERFPELRKELLAYKLTLADNSYELKPLKAWELQDMSFQAAQKALSSPSSTPLSQLTLLKDISQDFPSMSPMLAKVTIDPALRKEILELQRSLGSEGISAGDSSLLVNGISMDMDTFDMFVLYDVLREDLSTMELLSKHGIPNEDIGSVLRLLSSGKDQQYALDIRDSAIMYINDLDHDEMYQRWPKNLNALLQPTFPGMMRHLSRNLFNVVFFFNASDISVGGKLEFLYTLYGHQTPIRIGIVPVAADSDDAAQLLVHVFLHMKEENGGGQALMQLSRYYRELSSKANGKVSTSGIKTFFRHFVSNMDDVASDEEHSNARLKAFHFFERTGLRTLPQLLHNGVSLGDVSVDAFEETIVSEVLQATPTFQKAVYHGKLTDDMDPLEWLMMQDHVMPRLNARILASEKRCVNLQYGANGNSLDGPVLENMSYITKRDEDEHKELTMLVVADLDTIAGREMFYNAIKHVKTSAKIRLGLIHNPADSPSSDLSIADIVQVALKTLPVAEARSFVTKLVKEENAKELLSGEKTLVDLAVNGMDVGAFLSALKGAKPFKDDHWKFVHSKLAFKPGQRAVISNGLVIGPLDDTEQFTQDDFMLLEKVSLVKAVEQVTRTLKKHNWNGQRSSDVIAQVMGTLTCTKAEKNRRDWTLSAQGRGVIRLPPVHDGPTFDVVAVVDPLSRSAQKILPIVLTLNKVINCDIKVYLNCRDKLSELPLKSFFRYVIDPEVKFNVVGGLASGPEAYFEHLPHRSLLTLNVLPPEGWMVESVNAIYDLDNIKLSEIKSGVEAGYELEYLLLEGHCYDAENGQPPRGMQFVLAPNKTQQAAIMDTIVMANLGYFQLKAKPGLWHLMIREGRSNDIYQMSGHEGTDSQSESPDVIVLMDSFKSRIINVKVKKREGMADQDVLSEGSDEEQGGLWNSISSSFASASKSADEKDTHLNIFSLASGHLYERFMRIMILSIVKQTKSPVKFWLLKNYLSPEFKKFIPFMAEKYGFQYELVQYKWPRWLNQQTEKQRIMWGYKILFLDVLFPLDVNKIAFIDADQTVRADIQELFDLDLEGAPYGYTPFCDSRKEMDGFRFWKSGYWSNHLGRRPYHISALYIIDLKRFRKVAAGDRLRGQYQALSQDPNSLSNLDQDLPNNMIHQVRIKSLPQEWLWCETWCDDASKKTAKTIDLCNNPLTKEPKLEAAKRIVPEWVGYDTEIRDLWDIWHGKTGQGESTFDPITSDNRHKPHVEL